MGWFSFLKPKRLSHAHVGLTPEEVAALEGNRPRHHHYTMAHYALRSVAFEDPLFYMGIMASPQAGQFLTSLLESVSKQAPHEIPSLSATDLTIHPVRVGRYACAVVEFPEPQQTTEVFFTAAVLLNELREEVPAPHELQMRYFTLEKGMVLRGPPRTVFCEWSADGTHSNHGDGPSPELRAFADAVERTVLG